MPSFSAVEVVSSAELEYVAQLFKRQLASRCGDYVVYFLTDDRSRMYVRLAVTKDMPAESFSIAQTDSLTISITGGDIRGLIYGVGKFLRGSRYALSEFTPSPWRGQDQPQRQVRAIYLASHGNNWFINAPDKDILRYVEDLALWGFNTIAFWYCMADFPSADHPRALAAAKLFKRLIEAAHRIDMGVTTIVMTNEPYGDTPETLRANWAVENGYTAKPIAWFYPQICPSRPGGMELIAENRRKMLDMFADVQFDGFIFWPYDQGGCTCAQCAPWGANGNVRTLPQVIDLCRKHSPKAKIIVSTWEMDKFTTGEFDGMDRALRAGTFGHVDYVLAENLLGKPVPWIEKNGVPGGLPLVGFPEISMWGIEPWGGYGAIVNPAGLQAGWDHIKHLSQGGFPYSEGIYEDVNKAICAGFYWNDRPAQETLREYVGFEFGPEFEEEGVALLNLLENSFPREIVGKKTPLRFVLKNPELAEHAFSLSQALEARMPARIRRSWRWRVIALRCIIDVELVRAGGLVNETCEDALNELTEIYHYGPESNYLIHPQRILRHGNARRSQAAAAATLPKPAPQP